MHVSYGYFSAWEYFLLPPLHSVTHMCANVEMPLLIFWFFKGLKMTPAFLRAGLWHHYSYHFFIRPAKILPLHNNLLECRACWWMRLKVLFTTALMGIPDLRSAWISRWKPVRKLSHVAVWGRGCPWGDPAESWGAPSGCRFPGPAAAPSRLGDGTLPRRGLSPRWLLLGLGGFCDRGLGLFGVLLACPVTGERQGVV